jgi:hypothetical protein
MRRSTALLTRFTAFAALTLALTLSPLVFRGGGAEAKTIQQCFDRYNACMKRCTGGIEASTVKAGSKEQKKFVACDQRTCGHQHKNCVGTASTDKKPTKAVAPPKVGAGGTETPKVSPTKVQPKMRPGGTETTGTAPTTQPLTLRKGSQQNSSPQPKTTSSSSRKN